MRALKEKEADSPREKRKQEQQEIGKGEPRARGVLETDGDMGEISGDVHRHHDENGQAPQIVQGLPSLCHPAPFPGVYRAGLDGCHGKTAVFRQPRIDIHRVWPALNQ